MRSGFRMPILRCPHRLFGERFGGFAQQCVTSVAGNGLAAEFDLLGTRDPSPFLAAPAAINGYVFPNDDLPTSKVRKWLDECTATGLVHEYGSPIRYGVLPTWHEHQVINRYTPSTLPEPDVQCTPRKGTR